VQADTDGIGSASDDSGRLIEAEALKGEHDEEALIGTQ
jgi:hypothetical protein